MTPRRQRPQPAKVSVPDADDMLAQTFRLHCQKRHPLMKFYSRGEHAADHRLHAEAIDHVHGKEASDAGAGDKAEGGDNGQPDD